ncbi:722_t:CDS:2, partial [Funneliformis geosporum]
MEDLLRKLGFSEAMFGNSVEEIVEQGKNTTDYSELLTIIKQLDHHNKRETQAEAIQADELKKCEERLLDRSKATFQSEVGDREWQDKLLGWHKEIRLLRSERLSWLPPKRRGELKFSLEAIFLAHDLEIGQFHDLAELLSAFQKVFALSTPEEAVINQSQQ